MTTHQPELPALHDQVREAAESNRNLAKTIRQYGTCAPSALELVAGRIENLADQVAALSRPQDGWVLVPVEPTDKMQVAGWCAHWEDTKPRDVWAAMLGALPSSYVTPMPNNPALVNPSLDDAWKNIITRHGLGPIDRDVAAVTHALAKASATPTAGQGASALGEGSMVSALEVFRICGGDVECCPNPSAQAAIDCLQDLRNCYDSALMELRPVPTPAPAAPVSERATVSLDLNNLPAEWPWDEGSPCLDPRPVGMVYPGVPTPRAFGYLDKTGVEWAAYDTGQMEEYGRRAFADGANTALRAIEQALTQQWGGEVACAAGYAVAEAFLASYNSHCTDPAPNLYHDENGAQFGHDDWGRQISVPNPRCRNLTESEYVMTAVRLALLTALAPIDVTTPQPSAEGLRELARRWRDDAAGAKNYSLTEYEKGWAAKQRRCADELESLLAGGGV